MIHKNYVSDMGGRGTPDAPHHLRRILYIIRYMMNKEFVVS